jgi:hypothetical protein
VKDEAAERCLPASREWQEDEWQENKSLAEMPGRNLPFVVRHLLANHVLAVSCIWFVGPPVTAEILASSFRRSRKRMARQGEVAHF